MIITAQPKGGVCPVLILLPERTLWLFSSLASSLCSEVTTASPRTISSARTGGRDAYRMELSFSEPLASKSLEIKEIERSHWPSNEVGRCGGVEQDRQFNGYIHTPAFFPPCSRHFRQNSDRGNSGVTTCTIIDGITGPSRLQCANHYQYGACVHGEWRLKVHQWNRYIILCAMCQHLWTARNS